MKILIDRPANVYDSFELISADVKSNPLNPDPEQGRPLPISAEELAKQENWTKKCSALFKVPEEPPEDSGVKYPDLIDESNLTEWAGISLGKGDTYRLYLAVKKLAESLPGEVDRLRFFGKINTRGAPYFIVEGLTVEDEEGMDEFKQEGKAGANKYTYWVTQSVDASGGWIKLPSVTMAQIVASRQFKRFFTGDLNADVPSYPPFPGTERNFLRTQIALIVGATLISPDGHFELDEEDPPGVRPAEAEALAERFPKTSDELKDPEAWKHHETDLNALGRITKLPEQLDESGEPIVPDDPIEPNAPLDAIKPEAWTFRLCPGGAGKASGSSVVARSLVWPGAVAIAGASGRRFINIYVGNGVIYDAKPYSPPLPQPIHSEFIALEDDPLQLVEQPDVKVDPTPPAPDVDADAD